MATINPTTPEGRAHIRAIAVDAPTDRAVLLTRENVAQLLDAIENAAQDALEGFEVRAETQVGLAVSPAAREAWNNVAQAIHDYRADCQPQRQYRVRVWCRDCTDEDPAGCFNGGHGWIEVREHPAEGGVYRVDDSGISPSRAAIFPDMNTAEDARAEVESNDCWAGPWDTEIVDQAGNAVPASDCTPSGRPLPSDHADRHGVQHGSQEATR